MLTELQKNIAIRLAMGHSHKALAEEYRVELRSIVDWLKLSEFLKFMEDLGNKNREKIVQYLESKQMGYIQRLEGLSDQGEELSVARKSTVDLLGYSGLENRNLGSPLISNINSNLNALNAPAARRETGSIDNRLEEIDKMLGAGVKPMKLIGKGKGEIVKKNGKKK